MTERLSDITAHIENVRQLEAVVTAMRGIAAAHAQQSRKLIAGIESYANVVARAIGEALMFALSDQKPAVEAEEKRKLLILFCAEGGFCGNLSDRVLDATAGLAHHAVYVVGSRGITKAEERGLAPVWTTASANQLGAVPLIAERIAAALYRGVAAGQYLRAEILYPKPVAGGAFMVERQQLIPVDMRQFPVASRPQPPLLNLSWDSLIAQLAEEYVYAQLCDAAMHSFIAENDARMMAMTVARTHIEDRLAGLIRSQHNARQEEITDEIVELSAALRR
jgi:F-type H+-transporting ATPase subunit gamma